MWSSILSESFMKIGDYACRAPFAIFWSLHGIALNYYMKSNMPTNRLRLKFSKMALICNKTCMFLDIPPVPTKLRQVSATFVWQDKSSEKKLSEFMVYK